MPPSANSSTLLASFQSLFSAPTWRKAQRLLVGTLLAHGRRTVTTALRHTGQGDTPSFSLYHQVALHKKSILHKKSGFCTKSQSSLDLNQDMMGSTIVFKFPTFLSSCRRPFGLRQIITRRHSGVHG